MFNSESQLLQVIAEYDLLVHQCLKGEIDFWSFCDKYNDFYAHYALDGHESDEEEQLLFDKHDKRIEPHRIITCDILGMVCSDENAKLDIYIKAGRFGSVEALERMRKIQFTA